MDKVNNSNRQSMPLWERQKASRGHRSAVDGALKAHRERAMEREARVQERLNMVRNMHTQFFPRPNVMNRPELANDPMTNGPVNTAPINQAPIEINNVASDVASIDEVQNFNPSSIDEIYSEAQLGTSNDNAMVLVQKDIANPEEGPVDDMPKGSYIDYTV